MSLICLSLVCVIGMVVVAVVDPEALTTSDDNLRERHFSGPRFGEHRVAIVRVEGTIVDGESVVDQIERVRNDRRVRALVLRVNSPGGTVTGSDYIHHHLTKLLNERKLPVVVSMGSLAASGGYYVSTAVADGKEALIYAEPTTWTGSIGVIIPHYNVAGLMKRFEVVDDSIASHELKQMGSFSRELSPKEREIFQSLVDESFGRFKSLVRKARPKLRDDAALDRVATGQVFTTQQALDNGLVDHEGFLEDAVDKALELAGLDKDRTTVIEYESPVTLVDLLMGSAPRRSPSEGELGRALSLLAPRAYYLCWWPDAAALARP